LYPDVLEGVSNLIADEAGETSSEVSWTTAEEVEELPVLLYGIIVGIMIILGIVVAMSSRRLQKKEYVELEEESDVEETEEEETDEDEVEESDEEETEDLTWTDADGNPIVSVKDE
jgi:flagellar biosynthesis/type III secretory pathway M-ring protein FliF/YscJ